MALAPMALAESDNKGRPGECTPFEVFESTLVVASAMMRSYANGQSTTHSNYQLAGNVDIQ